MRLSLISPLFWHVAFSDTLWQGVSLHSGRGSYCLLGDSIRLEAGKHAAEPPQIQRGKSRDGFGHPSAVHIQSTIQPHIWRILPRIKFWRAINADKRRSTSTRGTCEKRLFEEENPLARVASGNRRLFRSCS